MSLNTIQIQPLSEEWRAWAAALITARWGAPHVVSRGRLYEPAQLNGFVALEGSRPTGLATYRLEAGQCELVSIDSLVERAGVGSALVAAVRAAAAAAGCTRLWLITTNDNLQALRFYQKRGFALVALHRGALVKSRELKPQIPQVGRDGIPLRDELELEAILQET